jgi:hypothetical protein
VANPQAADRPAGGRPPKGRPPKELIVITPWQPSNYYPFSVCLIMTSTDSEQRKIEHNPKLHNFNAKTYKFLGALPAGARLRRSPDIDRMKTKMLRSEVQEGVAKLLRRDAALPSKAREDSVSITFSVTTTFATAIPTATASATASATATATAIPAKFLDDLQEETCSTKLNFVILLLVVTGERQELSVSDTKD